MPEATTEFYSPEDILAFQFNGAEARGPGGRQRSFWGSPVTTARRPPHRTDEKFRPEDGPGSNNGQGVPGERKRPQDKERARRAAAPYFRIASIPEGSDKQRILVECEQDCNNAELRIFVDENIDATCDRQLPSQVAPLLLSDVSVDGKPVPGGDLIKGDEGVIGVDLGNLTAASSIVVEMSYAIPNGVVCVVPGHHPTLRIEIASRVETTQSAPVKDKETGESFGA